MKVWRKSHSNILSILAYDWSFDQRNSAAQVNNNWHRISSKHRNRHCTSRMFKTIGCASWHRQHGPRAIKAPQGTLLTRSLSLSKSHIHLKWLPAHQPQEQLWVKWLAQGHNSDRAGTLQVLTNSLLHVHWHNSLWLYLSWAAGGFGIEGEARGDVYWQDCVPFKAKLSKFIYIAHLQTTDVAPKYFTIKET